MPLITFRFPDGRTSAFETPAGDTVMDSALDNEVPGIEGRCGGACNCSTCHVYVQAAWFDRLPGAGAAELELLGYLRMRQVTSRLGCQITLTDAFDGLEVSVPPPEPET